MKQQDPPSHSLHSFARYLNKFFDFRRLVTQLTDARQDPEIPPAAVFLTGFPWLGFSACPVFTSSRLN